MIAGLAGAVVPTNNCFHDPVNEPVNDPVNGVFTVLNCSELEIVPIGNPEGNTYDDETARLAVPKYPTPFAIELVYVEAETLPCTCKMFCIPVLTPMPTCPAPLINNRVVASELGPPANNRTLEGPPTDAFPTCNSPTLDVKYRYPSLAAPTNPPL